MYTEHILNQVSRQTLHNAGLCALLWNGYLISRQHYIIYTTLYNSHFLKVKKSQTLKTVSWFLSKDKNTTKEQSHFQVN